MAGLRADETIRLALAAAAEIVDAGAGAALVVAEADRAVGFARARAAVTVAAQVLATFGRCITSGTLGLALDAAAERILTHIGAAF